MEKSINYRYTVIDCVYLLYYTRSYNLLLLWYAFVQRLRVPTQEHKNNKKNG